MDEERHFTLAQATEMTLRIFGPAILSEPRRFVGCALDYLDAEAAEAIILMRNCDGHLLDPYRAVIEGQMDLSEAMARADAYLTQDCFIATDAAQAIVRGLATGVASYLGTSMPHEAKAGGFSTSDVGTATPNTAVPDSVVYDQHGETEELVPAPQHNRTRLVAGIVAAVIVVVCVGAAWMLTFGTTGGNRFSGHAATSGKGEDGGIWLCTEEITKSGDGKTTYVDQKTYDERGNLLTRRYKDEDLIEKGYWYVSDYGDYDEYGHEGYRTDTDVYDDGASHELQWERAFEYDLFDDGRIRTKVERVDADEGEDPHTHITSVHDARVSTSDYTYDGTTLTEIIETVVDPNDDSDKQTYELRYDPYGHMTFFKRKSEYRSSDETTRTSSSVSEHDYELDGSGRILKDAYTNTEVDSDGNSTVEKHVYEYDEHESVVKDTVSSDGTQTVNEFKNTYDEHGNLITHKNLTNGDTTTYAYVFVQNPTPVAAGNIINW